MSGLEWSRISKKFNDVTKSQAKLGLQAKHELRDCRHVARANPPTSTVHSPICVYPILLQIHRQHCLQKQRIYHNTNNKYKANSIAGKCQIKKNYIQFKWLRNIFSSQNTVRIGKSQRKPPKGQINVTCLRPHSLAEIAGIKRPETSICIPQNMI